MKCPLSICMIVRNEERNVADSLRSVLPYAEEWIVVDTGSTDRTVEVARDLGAQLFTYPWTDDFSAARNHAIERATKPFVFMLDADEQFDPDGAADLAAFCRRDDGVAGRVQVRSVIDAEGTVSATEITRIFPNLPNYRYQGRIHEQLLCDGQVPATVSTGIVLAHHGYLPSAVTNAGKVERNLRLLRLAAQEAPDDPYMAYQIGKTHYVGKSYAEAVQAFRKALDLLGQKRLSAVPPYLSTLFVQMAYALLYRKEFAALYEVLGTGVEWFPDFTDLYFVYGLALIEQGDGRKLTEIRDVFTHCLRLGEPDPAVYETVSGVGTYRAQHNLGVLYEVTGDWKQAREHYRLAFAQGFAPAGERLRQLTDGRV